MSQQWQNVNSSQSFNYVPMKIYIGKNTTTTTLIKNTQIPFFATLDTENTTQQYCSQYLILSPTVSTIPTFSQIFLLFYCYFLFEKACISLFQSVLWIQKIVPNHCQHPFFFPIFLLFFLPFLFGKASISLFRSEP